MLRATELCTFVVVVVLLSITIATSSFDIRPNNRNQFPLLRSLAKSTMSSLTADGGGSRGTGTSSWPSMHRPPAQPGETDVESVPAIMNYVSTKTIEISTRRDIGGSDDALVGAIWNPTLVRVANARLRAGERRMNLDDNGFELCSNDDLRGENMNPFQHIDFCNQDQVIDVYYPMCERLVAKALTSQKSYITTPSSSSPIAMVCAFDHNVRSSDRAAVGNIQSKCNPSTASEEEGDDEGNADSKHIMPQVQNPAGIVHADYTKVSAPRRLHDLSNPPKLNDVLRLKLLAERRNSLLDPTMVDEALKGERRFAFINVWRSIDAVSPVKNPPLACIDSASTTADDLRTFKIHYTDRIGENYFVCPPPSSSTTTTSSNRRQHAWYYYPDMTIHEGLLLKQWDSMGGFACDGQRDGAMHSNHGGTLDGGGLSTFTIHSAFIDPSCSDSPPRKSIEVRCVAIWEKKSNSN
jgi:hypothetical protein